MHALIIEDNEYNIQILEQLLQIRNIAYTIVRNPLQLSNIIEALPGIDIVFLDLELPGMTGFEVCDILQNHYAITTPIVAYSIHIDKMSEARRCGFHSFLGKPLAVDHFFDNIERIMNNEPVWESA